MMTLEVTGKGKILSSLKRLKAYGACHIFIILLKMIPLIHHPCTRIICHFLFTSEEE
jgi:hypothetical protein